MIGGFPSHSPIGLVWSLTEREVVKGASEHVKSMVVAALRILFGPTQYSTPVFSGRTPRPVEEIA